ncbi:hypothetical protein PPACK8108_LOCUS5571 [Phakopsora pachyrhizi]|uniref:Uncharacterized protein n=1 Tax=Phakopsora pachyrhizi TaxID=170000 RepID=A0AAV0APB2_PHAPC|nr:hypothetical protein PPACK8108_LOCUS5571 [Phakopsora pachyrhizi]
MINKTALINQHIYEIEKLRHDLIVTQTKNGLYLSEDRRAEIRHKSESKSGNLEGDGLLWINKDWRLLEFSGEKRVRLTNPVVVVVGAPVLEEELNSKPFWAPASHSLIDFETPDDDEVIARGPPMLLTKTERAMEPSKSSEQIKRISDLRSNNVQYTSFAQVLQSVSSDELDYLVPENGPLNNLMSLAPDERDYCTLKHNRWQLVQMFHQINKADDLPLKVGRDSLKITKSLRQIQNIVLKRLLDHFGPKLQYLRVDDLQGYWQMESWKSHQSITNHDQ